MGYLNKICKFIRRLFTIWKLNQHPTKGKNPLSTSPKDIVHYCYYDNHIFHHSNFTISNSGSKKIADKHSIVLYAYLSIQNHKPISPSKVLPPLLYFPKYFFLTAVMIMSIYLLRNHRSDIEWNLQKFVTDTSCNFVINWADKGKVARLIR